MSEIHRASYRALVAALRDEFSATALEVIWGLMRPERYNVTSVGTLVQAVHEARDPAYDTEAAFVAAHYIVDVGKPAEWITANQRLHWRRKAERTALWRESAAWWARQNKVPRLARGSIIGELRFATQRRRDPANWAPTAKACVDGLVDAGVFDDDDATRVTGPDMRIRPGFSRRDGLSLLIYPEGFGDSL